jgi:hypothetical protein
MKILISVTCKENILKKKKYKKHSNVTVWSVQRVYVRGKTQSNFNNAEKPTKQAVKSKILMKTPYVLLYGL